MTGYQVMSFMAEIALVSLKALKNNSNVRRLRTFIVYLILSGRLVSASTISCANSTSKVAVHCRTCCNRFSVEGHCQTNEVSAI
jgi:hypothetical protein